jgi:uncharacterized membrane-anchored protein
MLVMDKAVHSSMTWISKVPQVTLMFWIVKILATTVGETGGDSLSMTMKLGYGLSTLVVLGFFVITLAIQLRSKAYHPATYWAVVVATTTVGTTTSDYFDRTLNLGYVTSSAILIMAVLAVLFVWRRVVGRVEFENIATKTEELFYWLTILVSNTLGTALGDFVATTTGLGFERGALVFSGLLALIAAAHFWSKRLPTSVVFWAAYVLTRPLGATLGDTLTKGHVDGGLALGTIPSSLSIAVAMVAAIFVVTMRERRTARIR